MNFYGLIEYDYKYLDVLPLVLTGIQHPVPSIQKLLDDRVKSLAPTSDFITVATANFAHLPFVLNLLESVKLHMRDHVRILIVCFDDEIYVEMQKRKVPSLKLSELFDYQKQDQNNLDDGQLKKEQTFGDTTYFRLANMKVDVAYILLKYYDFKYMIYTDTDIVMLKPQMTEYFSMLFEYRSMEMLFSTSGEGKVYPCTGFYVAKKGNYAIDFLGEILAAPEKKTDGDQTFADRNYQKMPAEMKLQFHILDTIFFFDGGNVGWQLKFEVKPWLFHSNYIIGFAKKKIRLQDNHFWFLKD